MRTHELAQILLSHPDMEVVLQKDEEGNGYKTCRGVDYDVVYQQDSGEVYARGWTADEADLEEDEWEELKKTSDPVVVLFP